MATKNNTAAENVESFEVAEETAVPRQSKPEAKVTSIKKNEEPEFYDDEIAEAAGKLHSIVKNAKRLTKDKRVVAGAVTTLLLTVGVVVARKRNTVEDDVNETPEA